MDQVIDPEPLSLVLDRSMPEVSHRRGSSPPEDPTRPQREAELEKLLGKVGRRYANATFSRYQPTCDEQRRVVTALRAYCDNWPENAEHGRGLLLYGPRGTGKDHLAVAAIGKILTSHLVSVEWVDGQELFAMMRDRITSDVSESAPIKALTTTDVLIVSDPLPQSADEKLTNYQQSILWRVVDRRYRDCRPTWLTLNVADSAEAAKRLGPQIADRLTDGALALQCNWKSYRKPFDVVK